MVQIRLSLASKFITLLDKRNFQKGFLLNNAYAKACQKGNTFLMLGRSIQFLTELFGFI